MLETLEQSFRIGSAPQPQTKRPRWGYEKLRRDSWTSPDVERTPSRTQGIAEEAHPQPQTTSDANAHRIEDTGAAAQRPGTPPSLPPGYLRIGNKPNTARSLASQQHEQNVNDEEQNDRELQLVRSPRCRFIVESGVSVTHDV